MRLSVDETDPGYITYRALKRIGVEHTVRVYLDGEKAESVITADEEKGEIVAHGERVGRSLSVKTLRGKVEIRFEKRSVGPDLP